MLSRKPDRKLLVWAIVTALAATSLPLVAQEAATSAGQDEEPTTLGTMMVTAQKREEAMQDVPISVTALPEQLL